MKKISVLLVVLLLTSCEKKPTETNIFQSKPITSIDDSSFSGTEFYRITGSDRSIWTKFDKLNDSMYVKVTSNQSISNDLINSGTYRKKGDTLIDIKDKYNKYYFINDTLINYSTGYLFKPKN